MDKIRLTKSLRAIALGADVNVVVWLVVFGSSLRDTEPDFWLLAGLIFAAVLAWQARATYRKVLTWIV